MLNPLTVVVELFHVAFWRFLPSTTDRLAEDPGFATTDVVSLWWVALLLSAGTFVVGNLVFERSKRRFAHEL